MNHHVKETLMRHKSSLGLDVHYYRRTDQKLLTEYLKVINALTVNEEFRLSKQVKELNENNEYQNYVIDKKIKSLEDFVQKMFDKFEKIDNIERKKLYQKIKEANDKGECYAIYHSDKRPTEKEILEKELKDDVERHWFVLLRDNKLFKITNTVVILNDGEIHLITILNLRMVIMF